MTSWIDFWDRPNAIYVNQRNLNAHFECLTRDLEQLVPVGDKKVILDFGCGVGRLACEKKRSGAPLRHSSRPALVGCRSPLLSRAIADISFSL